MMICIHPQAIPPLREHAQGALTPVGDDGPEKKLGSKNSGT